MSNDVLPKAPIIPFALKSVLSGFTPAIPAFSKLDFASRLSSAVGSGPSVASRPPRPPTESPPPASALHVTGAARRTVPSVSSVEFTVTSNPSAPCSFVFVKFPTSCSLFLLFPPSAGEAFGVCKLCLLASKSFCSRSSVGEGVPGSARCPSSARSGARASGLSRAVVTCCFASASKLFRGRRSPGTAAPLEIRPCVCWRPRFLLPFFALFLPEPRSAADLQRGPSWAPGPLPGVRDYTRGWHPVVLRAAGVSRPGWARLPVL